MRTKAPFFLICTPLLLACFAGTIVPSAAISTPAQVIQVSQPQPPTDTPQPVQDVCTVSAESLNVRSAPENGLEESKVLGWLYSGDIVTIRQQRGAWLYVNARGVAGWVKSTYCTQGK